MQTFRDVQKVKIKCRSQTKNGLKVGEYDIEFHNYQSALKPSKVPLVAHDEVSVATSPSKQDLIDISIKEKVSGRNSLDIATLNSERQKRFHSQPNQKQKKLAVKSTRATSLKSVRPAGGPPKNSKKQFV